MMKHIKLERFKQIAIFLLLLCGIGCGQHISDVCSKETKYVKNSLLKVPLKTNPSSLDPIKVFDSETAFNITIHIFEGLVQYSEDNKIVPCLAEKWDVFEHGKRFRFYLKKGVLFHSGNELTSKDVKWSFERACDMYHAAPMAQSFLNNIIGAPEMMAGKTKHLRGIEIVDRYTVDISLSKSTYTFLNKIWAPVASILDSKVCSRHKEIVSPEKMVGTGPFIADKFEVDSYFRMKRNPVYHGRVPEVKEVLLSIVTDSETIRNKFDAGDFAFRHVPVREIIKVKQDPSLRGMLHSFPKANTTYLSLSKNAYLPFNNARVRRAICMGIDRNRIIQVLFPNTGISVAKSLIPYQNLHIERNLEPSTLEFNPDRAKALLKEAGYDEINPLPPLLIAVPDNTPYVLKLLEHISIQLKNNLQIDVRLVHTNIAMYTEARLKSKYAIFFNTWLADYLDPNNFLHDCYHSQHGLFASDYNNPEFDRLVTECEEMKTEKERLNMLFQADDLIISDGIIFPICYLPNYILVKPYVKGLKHNSISPLPWNTIELKCSF